jgi:hypothetical protein
MGAVSIAGLAPDAGVVCGGVDAGALLGDEHATIVQATRPTATAQAVRMCGS